MSGTAGSGKTVIAAQFLAEGIRQSGETGVFVTFEESPDDIRRNILSLGWDVLAWEKNGQWAFVDASPQIGEEIVVSGQYDLNGLLTRNVIILRNVLEHLDRRRVHHRNAHLHHHRLDHSAALCGAARRNAARADRVEDARLPHDHDIHEFKIDGSGMHIGEPFRAVTGILSGNPVHLGPQY